MKDFECILGDSEILDEQLLWSLRPLCVCESTMTSDLLPLRIPKYTTLTGLAKSLVFLFLPMKVCWVRIFFGRAPMGVQVLVLVMPMTWP